MLASLRVLHVDTSNEPGTGSLDRAMAIHALSVARVGASGVSVYILRAGSLTCSGVICSEFLG